MNLLCENGVFTTMIIHVGLPAAAINGRSANLQHQPRFRMDRGMK
jgi:hypothetical protein